MALKASRARVRLRRTFRGRKVLETCLAGIGFEQRKRPDFAPSVRFALVVLCALTAASCKSDLYTNLDERHANEIVATLRQNGIPADRSLGKGNRVSVSVDESRFAEAVTVLSDNGLPREDFATLGEVFKRDTMVSSPVQERAQMIFALSQELARTVSEIDGVLSARVHLVLPENDPLRQQLVPSSASVFIRHRASAPISDLVPQVKMLVANGIAGLSYDKVSVVLVAAPERLLTSRDTGPAPRASNSRAFFVADWPLYGAAGLAIALAGAGIAVLLRRRPRLYQLAPEDVVKPDDEMNSR
jgi:type III secretion protein J